MVMATKLSVLPDYPKSLILPSSKCLRSKFLVLDCLHRTAFACSWRLYPGLYLCHVAIPSSLNGSRRMDWSVRSSADGGSEPSRSGTTGGTRLIRAIQAFQIKLNARIAETRKGFPMKVLFFLVGFYCATAFATVIGQTGDWDILSAGLAVVVVEGIGALMYKASLPLLEQLKSLITMFNYWKAGLSLGLFLDAFKYEMDFIIGLCNPFRFLDAFKHRIDMIIGLCNRFNFEIGMFPIFW
ncbi:ycf20-like protein [Magnolia sinica]|uniref:ycf20-like protein n=1 Tax=Magnolia sinica TaxID=86752 RepID=UPI002659A57F|nr:ycf20-like protein [Magnolia sinica]